MQCLTQEYIYTYISAFGKAKRKIAHVIMSVSEKLFDSMLYIVKVSLILLAT